MRTFNFILFFLIFVCCRQDKNKYFNAKNIIVNTNLKIETNDWIKIDNCYPYSKVCYNYQVPINGGFCRKSNDSIFIYLEGLKDLTDIIDTIMPPTEWGHFGISIIITPTEAFFNVGLANHVTTFEYKSINSTVTLDKSNYNVKDTLICDINYFGIHESDRVRMYGKIKLQVKNSNYTYETFEQDNKLNQFLSEAKNSPDTIQYVYLSNSGITKLPNELALFKNCTDLNLDFNNLQEADLSILENLKNLKSITIEHCHLAKFPYAILKLSKLENINISDNIIADLPEDLYKLSSLKDLDISNNKIKIVSDKINSLKKLENFIFYNTEIKRLPSSILELKNFKHISPNTEMDYFPKQLAKYLEYQYLYRHIKNFEEIKYQIPGYEE